MKTKSFTERGQALILMALAGIGLFAVVGLAVDGSAKFSDRRHAQNAADAAALAGALTKMESHRAGDPAATTWAKIVNAAEDRAQENGYATLEVNVYNPPNSGIYANCADVHFDCHDYVQVVIDSTINTFFARVVGIDQTHNHVEAVASGVQEQNDFNFGGNSIVALSPDGCALKAGGTTDVVINGGGMFSNSDESCAFQKTTCSGTIDVNDKDGNEGTVTMVGGYTINTSCWDPNGAYMDPGGAKQYSFPPPFQDPPEPAECGTAGTKTNDNAANTTTLTPGYFDSLPPSGQTKKTVYLTPGVYCVGSSFSTSGLDTVTVLPPASFGDANGVFIYLKSGGSFTINSSTQITLWAPTSGTYKNFLIFAAPNYGSGTPATCTINGDSTDQLKGTIYAPYCDVKLNGSSGTVLQAQIIGYTVNLTGASGVTLTYEADNNGTWNYPDQVGLSK